MTDYKTRFQGILRELFQFDAADLDFGIYRILNYKRDQIDRFVQEDIEKIVDQAFARHRDERMDNIGRLFEEARQKVIQGLGPDAFLPSGELKKEYEKTPLGKEYLGIKDRKDEADAIDEIKLLVFNDLYNFFSRYYDEGDFAPKYRYSIKGHKYAIPYNGEEVKLYWANHDQYYIKTGVLFRDYAFFTDGAKTFKIIFRTVAAREELGSNKATRARFFVLDDEKPMELEGKTLVIRLQYRELTASEVKRFEVAGGSNTAKQEKINQKVMDAVLEGLDNPNLKAALGVLYKNDKPLLLYQLSRFTAKNTRDFFIHKNLKTFLSEQLDYFIKAEVISIETLERERFLDKHITRARVVREIGEKIIDFLAQIEDFQKKLWEKKKFVLKTEYVITTDRVPTEFHQEILKNKAQKKEWKALGFGTISSKKALKEKKLPVDTRHFQKDFKERLLEKLTETADLDDLLDGLMIKSENWQGLNLLLEKYREQIECTYIDPPFNAHSSEIMYKNEYKHSSWLSLIENRLSLSKQMFADKHVYVIAIDEVEQERLGMLLAELFPSMEKSCITVVHNATGQQGTNFSFTHEYAYFIYPLGGSYIGLKDRSGNPDIRPLRNVSKGAHLRVDAANCFYPIYVKNGRIIGFGGLCDDDFHPGAANITRGNGVIEVYPIDTQGVERKWVFARQSVEEILGELKAVFDKRKGSWDIIRTKDRFNYKTVWTGPRYSANSYGSRILNLMLPGNSFTFPKSIYTVRDCLDAALNNKGSGLILDFFAGSGTTAHAVMNLNNEDGGRRKFILIEMANYFDTVMIPRIKKVAYSFNWKDGRPKDSNGNGVFFKYQVLEQYEDTLDNLELKENRDALNLFGSDYLLKYFLDFESRDNAALVNFEHFKKPFSYRLKVNFEEVGEPQEVIVDLPETFHYLLGLNVKKIKVRKDKRRKYLFSLGKKEGRLIAVVWREYDDKWTKTDFKRDREFIRQEIKDWAPQVVYINGQNTLTPKIGSHTAEIRAIEPEFRKRMVNGS